MLRMLIFLTLAVSNHAYSYETPNRNCNTDIHNGVLTCRGDCIKAKTKYIDTWFEYVGGQDVERSENDKVYAVYKFEAWGDYRWSYYYTRPTYYANEPLCELKIDGAQVICDDKKLSCSQNCIKREREYTEENCEFIN